MKTFNNDEAIQWINNTGILANVPSNGQEWHSIAKQLASGSDNHCRLRILLRDVLYYRLTNLAGCLLPYREDAFEPCLLWFTDWGMWNDHHERVAHRLVSLLRAAHDVKRQFIETPAHLFDASESIDAQTLLTTAMVVSWDVCLIPEHGDFFVYNSHHEYVDVVSRNAVVHADRLRALKEWGAHEVDCDRGI
jgi:hypothetical protein